VTIQLGIGIVALFFAAFSAAFILGAASAFLLEEHHYRDYHQ
jgi:hypothetical protein